MAARKRWRRSVTIVLVSLAALACLSCAYYNTLYNAKGKYKDAKKMPLDTEGKPTRGAISMYDDAIARCQTMIGTWPDSRHVDDAMLLIANCLYEQQRYDECVAQLDSLEIKQPDTELMPQARLLKGKALNKWGEHEEAIEVLSDYMNRWPSRGGRPEALYYLATSSIELGQYVGAVEYVRELEDRYSGNRYTFNAQLEAASILMQKEMYERAEEMYEALDEQRLPLDYRFTVWEGLATVYIKTGQYPEAMEVIDRLELMKLTPQTEPPVLLLKAEAFAGLDSTMRAIQVYGDVASRFSRGEYAAEAHYRLGEIWEAADSLERAKRSFESVPRAYARYDKSDEAIRRAGSISKLLKLEAADGDNSPEAEALRQFSVAELQLTQFNQPEKALESYQVILDQYPDSEYGPRSAFAVGYIYGIVLGDTVKARETYNLVQARYPGTQQATFAYMFVPSMTKSAVSQDALYQASAPPTPPPGIIPGATAAALLADSTGVLQPDSLGALTDSTAALTDTTRTMVPADTSSAIIPADTSSARTDTPPDTTETNTDTPADTTGSGGAAGAAPDSSSTSIKENE